MWNLCVFFFLILNLGTKYSYKRVSQTSCFPYRSTGYIVNVKTFRIKLTSYNVSVNLMTWTILLYGNQRLELTVVLIRRYNSLVTNFSLYFRLSRFFLILIYEYVLDIFEYFHRVSKSTKPTVLSIFG